MNPKGCWISIGLAMISVGTYIAWWANFRMESKDLGAEFIVGWAGACTFIPLSLICFAIAYFVDKKPPAAKEETAEKEPEYRWTTPDETHPSKDKSD